MFKRLTSTDIMISENDFLRKTCRICGNRYSENIDLFGENESSYLLKVHKLLPIKIDSLDSLPKNICHVCISVLDEFESLWDRSIEVQNVLKIICGRFKSSHYDEQNANSAETSGPENISLNINVQPNAEIESPRIFNLSINYNETTENEIASINYKDQPSKKISTIKFSMRDVSQNVKNNSTFKIKNKKTISKVRKTKKVDLNWKIKHETKKYRLKKNVQLSSDQVVQNIFREKKTLEYMCEKCKVIFTSESAQKNHHCHTYQIQENKFNFDDFVITKISGKEETTLYLCKNCNVILVCESAARGHKCITPITSIY